MAISRWDPFRDMMTLRQAMDRLFEDAMIRPGGSAMASGSGFPVDVADRDDHYEIRAELPGMKPEDVDVSVRGETLTISAQSQAENERTERDWIMRERRSGSCQRTIILPTMVDSEHAQARFEHGVLTLTLPKAAEARPRRIPIGGQQVRAGQPQMSPGQPTGQSRSTQPGSTAEQSPTGAGTGQPRQR